MVDPLEINFAISAHSSWKLRLKHALETKQFESDAESVAADDLCKFGMWLNSLDLEEVNLDHFSRVKSLHAEFHAIAAELVKIATAPDDLGADPSKLLEGAFSECSAKLTDALMAWKQSLVA
jgi:hypothetical protein